MDIRSSWVKLETGEKVLMIIKHHWFVVVRRLVRYVSLGLLPPIIGGVLYLLNLEWVLNAEVEQILLLLCGSLYYAALVVWFFHDWADYYLDMWIITNHRVIDINQRGMFSRVVSQYRMERIQDVVADVSGFLKTVLNFGDVRIETAGAEEQFAMEEIPYPRELVQKLHAWSHQRQGEINGGAH